MFGRKKQEVKKEYNYDNWEKDLGFLYLIMNKKKNITKEFVINIHNLQRNSADYLKDEDIEPIIDNCIQTTLAMIGDNYRKFLVDKYFGTIENLVAFITEDIYVELTADTINRNNQKIKESLQHKAISRITDLGKQGK